MPAVWKTRLDSAEPEYFQLVTARGKDRGNVIYSVWKYLSWPLTSPTGEQIIGRAGGDFDGRYSQRGVQWAVEAKKKAGILKPMNVHTLRHTYATHLLEEGLDILTIKDLLGHECIDTTMVYLHVSQTEKCRAFSPLDRLLPVQKVKASFEVAHVLRQHWTAVENHPQINSCQTEDFFCIETLSDCRSRRSRRCMYRMWDDAY